MAEEIVKAEGLVGIVRQFADDAVKAAESIEQLKSAPFVEAAKGLTEVIIAMAVAFTRGLPKVKQGDYFYESNKIYASQTSLYIDGGDYFGLKINTVNKTARIRSAYRDIFYRSIDSFFSRMEPEFMRGHREAVHIFNEYVLLPKRLSEFTKQVNDKAKERKALIQTALQARQIPEIEPKIEDPLEEKFRLLEAGVAK